eukprot:CAMPEP_0173151864 /NCGR_PEP_ID=MMETSP1105-20130129/11852_1 /TAXON_ID=2985 /ORGANISM="Ochromonas sp., Strain BG-1" /LENGTH=512 /DNA_ID=CAMNT_0014067357 /DNA_START=157 /DNA_END=1695 /DNA_ORIENTATION=+
MIQSSDKTKPDDTFINSISSPLCVRDTPSEEMPVITIDPRSLLEVADDKHRYGKNLRTYFKEFTTLFPDFRLSHYQSFNEKLESFRPFFSWLDDSDRRPNDLKDCSLQALDGDRVEYLETELDRMPYKYYINHEGLLEHVVSHELLTTQPKGDMFVLKDSFFYINEKRTKTIPRFHHSSFFGGDFVNSAGIIIVEKGKIKVVYPHSGHYRPLDRHLLWLLLFLQQQTINLSTLKVDAQRIFKVSRHAEKENGPKSKKMDCVYLLPGNVVLDFLRMKFKASDIGLLAQIKTASESVNEFQSPPQQTLSPTPSSSSSSSAKRAHVLEALLVSQGEHSEKVEQSHEEPSSSSQPSLTNPQSFPPPSRPPRYSASNSNPQLLANRDEPVHINRDMHILLAESPAIGTGSRKLVLATLSEGTHPSRENYSKSWLTEEDFYDEASSRNESVKRFCESEEKLSLNPQLSFTPSNNSSDFVSPDCKAPQIMLPLLVSNSCFSRASSTANLNLLSSSPVLN